MPPDSFQTIISRCAVCQRRFAVVDHYFQKSHCTPIHCEYGIISAVKDCDNVKKELFPSGVLLFVWLSNVFLYNVLSVVLKRKQLKKCVTPWNQKHVKYNSRYIEMHHTSNKCYLKPTMTLDSKGNWTAWDHNGNYFKPSLIYQILISMKSVCMPMEIW